jgi:hypothetical protein
VSGKCANAGGGPLGGETSAGSTTAGSTTDGTTTAGSTTGGAVGATDGSLQGGGCSMSRNGTTDTGAGFGGLVVVLGLAQARRRRSRAA